MKFVGAKLISSQPIITGSRLCESANVGWKIHAFRKKRLTTDFFGESGELGWEI